jgi:sortase A
VKFKQMHPNQSIFRKALIALCVIGGFILISQGSYIKVKAALANVLIDSTWQVAIDGQPPAKPWPWADTHVVAQIQVSRLGVSQFIMRDASGESLAFGAGSMRTDVLPAGEQHSILAGHRDTHFKFLQDLQVGDVIDLSNYQGRKQRYQVSSAMVLDTDEEELNVNLERHALTLVTCWPFNTIVPGGPLRYIVNAIPITEGVKNPNRLIGLHL